MLELVVLGYQDAMIFERAFDIVKAAKATSNATTVGFYFRSNHCLMLLVYRHNRVLCNGHIVSSFFPNSPEALDCFFESRFRWPFLESLLPFISKPFSYLGSYNLFFYLIISLIIFLNSLACTQKHNVLNVFDIEWCAVVHIFPHHSFIKRRIL